MLILIEKDGATRIPKEVKDVAEAQSFAADFPIHVVNADGSNTPFSEWLETHGEDSLLDDESVNQVDDFVNLQDSAVETKTYSDGITATGTAPLPELSPDQQDALVSQEEANRINDPAAE